MSTQPGQALLERRYRRLMLAYPRRYRRVRAEEMIGTLMEASEPGQQRPTRAQARNLLVGGLRERLRVPGSGVAKVAAVWTAVVLAWVGFGAGAWLGWQVAAPDLPSNQEATAIARTAFGNAGLDQPERREFLFGFDPEMENDPVLLALLGGDEYEAGAVSVAAHHRGRERDPRAVTRQAETRLRQAGWRILYNGPGRSWGDEMAATNGRYVVTVRWEVADAGTRELTISREAPWTVPPLAVSGASSAALAGWLLVGWVCRRVRARWTPERRGLVGGFGYLGLILTMMPTAVWLLATWEAATTSTGWRQPFWFPTVFIGLRPMLILAAVLGLVAVLVAALPRRTGDAWAGRVRPPRAAA